jgi:outer membrane protein OmpA-like peptidoglycan-associated protein
VADDDGNSLAGGATWGAESQATLKFKTNFSSVKDAIDNMTPENKTTLEKYAVLLLNESQLGLDVQGYASETGSESENIKLSEQRAQAAKEYIIQFLEVNGVENVRDKVGSRIYTTGNGPVDDGTGDNAENRRADVSLVNADGSELTADQGKKISQKRYK